MTENSQVLDSEEDSELDDIPQADEFSLLKDRARLMGLAFSNNIGIDALRKKVNTAMENGKSDASEDDAPIKNPLVQLESPSDAPVEAKTPEVKVSLRQYLQREQMKLIRIRITNMDPKKKDLPGEVITVANEYIGTVKKYIPYGEVSNEGYHVPYCIYEQLDSRRFLNIRVSKDPVTKQSRVETSWAREFSLEVLPPLTQKELAALATAQIAAGNS